MKDSVLNFCVQKCPKPNSAFHVIWERKKESFWLKYASDNGYTIDGLLSGNISLHISKHYGDDWYGWTLLADIFGLPTPLDWGKELTRLSELREKAITDLRGWLTWTPININLIVTPEDHSGNSGEYFSAGIAEDGYFIISEHDADDLEDGEKLPMDAHAYRIDNLPFHELIDLVSQVQKAVAEGAKA